jgi:hypothetical protein
MLFFWPFGFRESMAKLEVENGMEAEFLTTGIGVRVFMAMVNLLHDSRLIAAALASGGGSIGEVHSPTLEGENPWSRFC